MATTAEQEKQARELFVEQGVDPLEITKRLNIPRLELGMLIAKGEWRSAREHHIRTEAINNNVSPGKTRIELDMQGVTLDDHQTIADELAAIGKEIAREIRDARDLGALQKIRSRAEAYRTTVEATDRAIRLSRDVSGLRLGQPSARKLDDVTEVIYHTAYEKSELAEIDQVASVS